MWRRDFLKLSLLTPFVAVLGERATRAAWQPSVDHEPLPNRARHRFKLGQQDFLMDGHPFQIRSGEMNPLRVPRAYWRHRIRMARAMGLNTIALCLMWNALESEPGVFDMDSGRRDFVRFVHICAEEGMWVYLRPGPYVCAEWDFGGLPVYLLRDPDMQVRHLDNTHYMRAVGRYMDAIAPRIAPLMVEQGGPVLMLQVENEYASFGTDLAYLQCLRRMWEARGIKGPFSLSDGLGQIQKSGTYLEGAVLGLDGSTDFAGGQTIAGESPVWVGEGYTGWLTHWGDKHFQPDTYDKTLRKVLQQGRSFNLYVVDGGTNFGFTAGANAHGDGSHFQPVITSYDYGAPINERGIATPAYHALRNTLATALGKRLPSVPEAPKLARFPTVTPEPWASLWDHLPAPQRIKAPTPYELLFGQDHGLILYRTTIAGVSGGRLDVPGVHDYATISLDGQYLDYISRVRNPGLHSNEHIQLPVGTNASRSLDVLVDSFGHVGYGHYITDRKGLMGEVQLNGDTLRDWSAYSLPLDAAYLKRLGPSKRAACRPGVFFRADVHMKQIGDFYLDMSQWRKGYLWINGKLLGRYWNLGPQQHLYCPASWLKRGINELLVFDMHRTKSSPIRGRDTLHG